MSVYDQNFLGVSNSDKHYADKTAAALSGAFYNDYQSRFMPVENLLLAATDPSYYFQQGSKAMSAAGSAFDGAMESQNRQMQSLGLQLSPEQSKMQNTTSGLEKAKAMAGAFSQGYGGAQNSAMTVFGLGGRG